MSASTAYREATEQWNTHHDNPEDLIEDTRKAAAECRVIFTAARDFMRQSIEELEKIALRVERATRRMEILKETLKPLPPIDPKRDDDRLCKGELSIISALSGPAHFTPDCVSELAHLTGYAESSIRTYLPMLRAKGIVHPDKLELIENKP